MTFPGDISWRAEISCSPGNDTIERASVTRQLDRAIAALLTLLSAVTALATALPAALAPGDNFGPYNAVFLQGGIGISRPLSPQAELLQARASWTLVGWVRV